MQYFPPQVASMPGMNVTYVHIQYVPSPGTYVAKHKVLTDTLPLIWLQGSHQTCLGSNYVGVLPQHSFTIISPIHRWHCLGNCLPNSLRYQDGLAVFGSPNSWIGVLGNVELLWFSKPDSTSAVVWTVNVFVMSGVTRMTPLSCT